VNGGTGDREVYRRNENSNARVKTMRSDVTVMAETNIPSFAHAPCSFHNITDCSHTRTYILRNNFLESSATVLRNYSICMRQEECCSVLPQKPAGHALISYKRYHKLKQVLGRRHA
jgi:hypothetical protein